MGAILAIRDNNNNNVQKILYKRYYRILSNAIEVDKTMYINKEIGNYNNKVNIVWKVIASEKKKSLNLALSNCGLG